MCKSASAAKKYYSEEYYSEGKSLDSYYSDKNETIGQWGGKAASYLGLNGDISRHDFANLCDNINPETGRQLTARNNAERRVGYDFTFNASKSVSLAYTFGDEEQKKEILEAFRQSVSETMVEIEKGMLARVRIDGSDTDRETGNIAYGEFIHFTTRPIDGIPDPHLHSHCFVFNATYDEIEDKWKAGQFGEIKQDAPYYEALFHSKLAERLQQAGYGIERTANGFELQGIDEQTIDKFSLRTKEIEELANKLGITDDRKKSKLGAKTRENKRKAADTETVRNDWNNRLTPDEQKDLKRLKELKIVETIEVDETVKALEAVDHSLKHHLERKSVSTDKEILATAIKSSIGESSSDQVIEAFKANQSIISVREENRTFITTHEALQEENDLIKAAHDFMGRFKPINENYQFKNPELTDEQQRAVNTALTSTDGITIIAGKAGTGKTTLMKEIQRGIRESEKEIFAFAPSAKASRIVQRKAGFENAQTVALFIRSKEMQQSVKGGVIWIDEAGMLSNRDMNAVLTIAKEQGARIILTGDTKQHNSVDRGDALRILQKEAGIAPVMVDKIQRQKNELYKQAIKFLSRSDTEKGFKKLDKIGAIIETAPHEARVSMIADDYFKSSYKRNKQIREVLVISPTHREGDKVTEAIREKLKEKNIISSDEREFTILRSLQYTEAEKSRAENYKPGNYLIFHQNIKGVKAGSRFQITDIDNGNLVLRSNAGKEIYVGIDKAPAYTVYSPESIKLSQGDKIRFTGNGRSIGGTHLFNGTMYQVAGFDDAGNIRLSNGASIKPDFGTFSHGYVVTSHASQGENVDKVIISQSSMSFRASSQEQFYVSVSRGKEAVSIYTDDKEDLLRAVAKSSERRSAIELTSSNLTEKAIEVNRINLIDRIKEKAQITAQRLREILIKPEPIKSR